MDLRGMKMQDSFLATRQVFRVFTENCFEEIIIIAVNPQKSSLKKGQKKGVYIINKQSRISTAN